MAEEYASDGHRLARSGLPEYNMIATHAVPAYWTDVVPDISEDKQSLGAVQESKQTPNAQLVDE